MSGYEGVRKCLLLVRPPHCEKKVQLQIPRKNYSLVFLAIHTLSMFVESCVAR